MASEHAHAHHPVVRITVTQCSNDDPGELVVDIAVGPPLDTWTPDQITTALTEAIEARLTDCIGDFWRAWLAVRN